jgi:hypothetical protein
MSNEIITNTDVNDVSQNQPVFLDTIIGSIETIIDTSAGSVLIPASKPTNFINQIRIYKNTNTGTYRLYVYDVKNNAWKYTALL